MPISPLTAQVASTAASLTTLRSNIQVIEDYLQGKIDAADFQDQLKIIHGRRGSVHRIYGDRWTRNVQANQPNLVANPATDTWRLDKEALLDFSHYGDIDLDFWSIPTNQYSIKSSTAMRRFTWEKLGNVPTANANGTGKKIETNPNSWQNWMYNTPDPIVAIPGLANYLDGRDYTHRFPKDEYWDRWLTVPYASKRIWIPSGCVLYVTGNAVGTWGYNLSPWHEHDTDGVGDGVTAWSTGYDQSNELPAFFRLFIDRDNDNEWRKFSWETNEETFYANWSPIQDYPQVGYGGPGEAAAGRQQGREWSFTCAPRAHALVASQIVVPESGWYNISMRYNSRYFHGWIEDKGGGLYDWWEQFFLKGGTTGFRPGFISQARWESSGIGAVAVFNRDEIKGDDLGAEFGA